MEKKEHVSTVSDDLGLRELERLIEGWILDGEIRQLSGPTIEERRNVTGKLLWFFRDREFATVGTHQFRAFLGYVNTGHTDPRGRWGNPRNHQAVKPITARAYFRVTRTFLTWVTEEGALDVSPLAKSKPPVVQSDQVEPFTEEQLTALVTAARMGTHPKRDEAMIRFLLDTGCRMSEVIGLRFRDLDLTSRAARIYGKGRKERSVYFGRKTVRALYSYLREEEREPGAAVFLSDRGRTAGDPLTRSGLDKIVHRIADAANVKDGNCHRYRHTFAVMFLRSGGDAFTLQTLLGHTTADMTRKYVNFARADIQRSAMRHSPGDRI